MSTPALPKTTLTIPSVFHPLGDWLVPQALTHDSIGVRLARFRRDKGLTQKELAERLGVSQPVVSDYENDVIRLSADVVLQLARILEVSTDEILGLQRETRATGAPKDRRLARRLKAIDALPKRDQEALLRTIDAFIAKSS